MQENVKIINPERFKNNSFNYQNFNEQFKTNDNSMNSNRTL